MANNVKKRCFVLGAGFSAAIAGLPLTKDMFDYFEKELYCQKKLNPTSNIVQRGERLIQKIKETQSEKIEEPYMNSTIDSKIIKVKNWRNNFEGICTYIDLNLSYDVESLTKNKNGEEADLNTPPFELNTSPLKEMKGDIIFYLYLTLINKKGNIKFLENFRDRFLNNNSSIITFNYDLVLENYLYEIGLWYPTDGYGITFPMETEYDLPTSKIKILKLHGSLNWNIDSGEPKLAWNYSTNIRVFPYYPTDDLNVFFSPNAWILPSFIKQFSYPKLIQIWNEAANQIILADEVCFIGYSLPLADSAVYSFLSTIDFTKKSITIINSAPDIEELTNIYSMVLRKNKDEIKIISKPFEELLG